MAESGDGSRVESRDERRAPVESRAERWQTQEQSERAGRDEMQMVSAGRVESRGGRDETRIERDTQSEREKPRAMTPSNLSSCGALSCNLYRESATASHVENDLHEHANGCRKKRTRTSSASSAAHMSSSHALFHKTRVWQNRLKIYWRCENWECSGKITNKGSNHDVRNAYEHNLLISLSVQFYTAQFEWLINNEWEIIQRM